MPLFGADFKPEGQLEADNFDNTLMAFRRRVPFRPFAVAVVNSDRFEVDHQDGLVIRVAPTGRLVMLIGPGYPTRWPSHANRAGVMLTCAAKGLAG